MRIILLLITLFILARRRFQVPRVGVAVNEATDARPHHGGGEALPATALGRGR